MFKEKYLIFREGEPRPEFSEKPNGGLKERKAHSQDTAEDLLNEKSVEEKAEEVMRELYELFAKGDGSVSDKFFKDKQSGNFIFETFLGDEMKAYIIGKINSGVEFGGYRNGGITLLWWTPENEMITEINPSFLDKKVYESLNQDTKNLIAKAGREILEKKFQGDMKPIFEGLVLQKSIPKAFTFERFIKSDFSTDIRDIIKVNYDSRSTVYTWEITANGVLFTPSEATQKKGFEVIELKMEDYDLNLNYKKSVFEFLKKNEENDEEESHMVPDDEEEAHRMIDEDRKILAELERSSDQYDAKLEEYEDDLDVLSVENPDLEKFHHEFMKPFMEEVENGIKEALKKGISAHQIKTKIKNSAEELGLFDRLSDLAVSGEESKKIAKEYMDAVEKWGAVLFEKYGLPTHDHGEHGNYEEW